LFVTLAEKAKIEKQRIRDDRKRSLLSLLMQKEMIKHVFHCSSIDFEIKRTLEVSSDIIYKAIAIFIMQQNKPFVVVEEKYVSNSLKSWNYNVSHHGQFVAIASLSNLLVSRFTFECDI